MDKDDCAYAGLVRFELLGLGMLTALRDCYEVAEHHGDAAQKQHNGHCAQISLCHPRASRPM